MYTYKYTSKIIAVDINTCVVTTAHLHYLNGSQTRYIGTVSKHIKLHG